MITREELYKLGYDIKTKDVNLKKGSDDFRFSGENGSPYLVNLTDGKAEVVFPHKSKKKHLYFDDFEDFENWHNKENEIE